MLLSLYLRNLCLIQGHKASCVKFSSRAFIILSFTFGSPAFLIFVYGANCRENLVLCVDVWLFPQHLLTSLSFRWWVALGLCQPLGNECGSSPVPRSPSASSGQKHAVTIAAGFTVSLEIWQCEPSPSLSCFAAGLLILFLCFLT